MRYVVGVMLSILAIGLIFVLITMVHRVRALDEAISKSKGKPIAIRYSNDEIMANNKRVLKSSVYLLILLMPLLLLIIGLFSNDADVITWALSEFLFICVVSNVWFGISKLKQYIRRKSNEKGDKLSS